MPTKPKTEPDIQFGIDWAAAAAQSGVRHIPELNRRMHCARWNNGTESVYEHRKAIIQTIWPEHVYAWHEWAARRLKSTCEHHFYTMIGPGGCVSGDTKLLDPITGEEPTFRELVESGTAPIVMTLYGPERACVPYVKGREMLYEIRTSSGKSFLSTANHRLLTGRGYLRVSEVRIGDALPSYDVFHLQSNLEHAQSARAEGGVCSPKKAANYPGSCLAYYRPCGELPLWALGIDRSSFPSRVGAPKHSSSPSYEGDLDKGFPGIHSYSQSSRPSTLDSSLSDCPLGVARKLQHAPEGLERAAFQSLSLIHI